MHNQLLYNDAVFSTFCKNAIRSVMLIDDKFPTYEQLSEGKSEIDTHHLGKARVLHKAFRDQKVICDIENDTDTLDPDRVRKCDLIVLDYFLEDQNPSKSIELINKIAENKQLNLVVLYTSEDLDQVWLRIATNLRGQWEKYNEILTSDEHIQLWEELEKSSLTDIIDLESLKEYLFQSELPKTTSDAIKKEFDSLCKAEGKKFPWQVSSDFVKAWVHHYVVNILKLTTLNSKIKSIKGSSSSPKWLLVGNVFIAFQNKIKGDDHDASEIMKCLHDALLSWKPNAIRLITSEIQNALENEPLAFDHQIERDLKTQAGWLFNILKENEPEAITSAIDQLLKRVAGNIGEKLLSETNIAAFAKNVFVLEKSKLTSNTDANIPKAAAISVGLDNCEDHEIVHALNSDLSMQEFTGSFVTTGTIFKEDTGKLDNGKWYVCVSPACDMVPNQKNGSFAEAFDPNRAAKVLVLKPENINEALRDAHQSRFLFIEEKGKRLALSAYNGTTKQPDICMMYIHKHGNNSTLQMTSFNASVLSQDPAKTNEPILLTKTFTPKYQLREPYAARLQTHASHHMGRIGVDFISWAKKDETPVAQTAQGQPAVSQVTYKKKSQLHRQLKMKRIQLGGS